MKQVPNAFGAFLVVIGFAFCATGILAADDSIVVKGIVKEVTAGEKGSLILAEILVEVDAKGKHTFLLHKDTKVSLANK